MKLISVVLLSLFSVASLAADYTVQMKNIGADGSMVFEPGFIKVAAGDTVHFEPTDVGHNTESVPGLIPEGAKSWKGSFNEKVSITFDQEGVYVYQCMPHAVLAMVGVVQVGNATNLESVKANAGALNKRFVANKDRLNNYLDQVK